MARLFGAGGNRVLSLSTLALCFGLSACEAKVDTTGLLNPTVVPDAATSTPATDAATVAPAPDTRVDANTPPPDASTGSTPPDAGIAAPDAGASPLMDAASADAALSDAGDAGDIGDGGLLTGPVVLPDPAMPGPYGFVVEENVGKGFENPINMNDMPANNQYCEDFALSFGQDEAQSKMFAAIPMSLNMALYTLYRPKSFEAGKKYPILSWGNGTCALPQGYAALLSHLASHGFWVIAAHSRFVGDGVAQKKGIDLMIALSKDPTHAAFERVDADKVGVFGHSQGGLSTSVASDDPRVDTAVILNAGGGGGRAPTYYVTGEQDLAPFYSELSYALASAPAASINFKMSDHITLITQPMRTNPSVTAWFRYQLLADAAGKDYFIGASCKLCNRASEWAYEQKNLQ